MDRIINVKVGGNHLSKDNKNAGIRGEANVTRLRISFDDGWDGYAKTVTFWDAIGKNPVERTLTTDYLENIAENTRVYLIPIPAEPLAIAGELTFVIDGYVDGKRQRSFSDKLVVKDAPMTDSAGEPVDPMPTQAEQLQGQIDGIINTIQDATVAKDAAEAAQTAAESSAKSASESANTATIRAMQALESSLEAEKYAQKAEDTVGKTSYIGDNGNWYAWNSTEGGFYDTKVKAQSGSTVYLGDNPPPEADVWIDPDGERDIIDQTYNPESKNAQSGKAVAQAVADVDNTVSEAEKSLWNSKAGLMTEDGGEIFNDYENNAAICPYSQSSGYNTQAGTLAFSFKEHEYTEVDYDTTTNIGKYYLNTVDGITVGMPYTIVLHNNFGYQGTVTSIGEDYIEVTNYLLPNSEQIYELYYDTSYIIFPDNPEVKGDVLIGIAAHAEGRCTNAMSVGAHAEGGETIASAQYSHSEGRGSKSHGYASHAEGYNNQANGEASHAEGYLTVSNGIYSHAEGKTNYANGDCSHAEGEVTKANGIRSHAEGSGSIANGDNSHSEGRMSTSNGENSHAEGSYNNANGSNSHAEGSYNNANGFNSHAEGHKTTALGVYAHAEGCETNANGFNSHAEGYCTYAEGSRSHAEGQGTQANGDQSHSEGYYTKALGHNSHTEGYKCKTAKAAQHSHAEGSDTYVEGIGAHAEGINTIAQGAYSHVEGNGALSKSTGAHAHAEGKGTIAGSANQHVQGKFNIEDNKGEFAHIVGNGKSDTERSNAHILDWEGNAWFAGDIQAGDVSLQSLKTAITTSTESTLSFDFSTTYNAELRTGELTTISFTFGDGEYAQDYTSGLSFDSGETPTAIDYTDSGILNWVGTDCATSDGLSIFQPSANTHYDIVFYFNGVQFIGLVNGFVPATGNVVSE